MSAWINRLANLVATLSDEIQGCDQLFSLTLGGDECPHDLYVRQIAQFRQVPEGFADLVVACGDPHFTKENIHRRLNTKVQQCLADACFHWIRLTHARAFLFQIEEVSAALKRNLRASSQGGRITNSLMTMGPNVCRVVFLAAFPSRFLRHLPATLPSDYILSGEYRHVCREDPDTFISEVRNIIVARASGSGHS